ncbi:MAG: hypothetical protein HYS44_00275 [Candidatus Niyogibacteria bacterium]|nr:hypothetical protein [Candidatus Niyogibacteria bacterium]
MRRILIVVLLLFGFAAIAEANDESPSVMLMNFYALVDVGSGHGDSFKRYGGGIFVTNNGLLGLEVDDVPFNGSHYGFVGVSSQSPVFFMVLPVRPVFAIGALAGTLGWRVGFDIGGITGHSSSVFLGPSLWKNIDGLNITTFTIGFGF